MSGFPSAALSSIGIATGRKKKRLPHAAGKVVHVWTINDRPEMERLIDLGVDGLVSDDLATLKAVLVERDLWEGHA